MKSMSGIVDVIAGLVTVAMIATIVNSGYSAGVIKASGDAFAGLFKSAQGR